MFCERCLRCMNYYSTLETLSACIIKEFRPIDWLFAGLNLTQGCYRADTYNGFV